MAWTWNGNAAASAFPSTIGAAPYLVKKYSVVADGATGEEASHGESTAPDMVFLTSNKENPTGHEITHIASSDDTTLVKLDVQAALSFTCIMIWFDAASGGTSA